MGFHRVRVLTITPTPTISLVKNLYWHCTGILLRLPERKDFESFRAPLLKFPKKFLVSLTCKNGREEIRALHGGTHKTVFGSLSDKIALI